MQLESLVGTKLLEAHSQIENLEDGIIEKLKIVFFSFKVIMIMCYFNMMFFIQHFISFTFVTKMGRHFEFPTFMHLADLTMFVSSSVLIIWINQDVIGGIPDEDSSTKKDYE